MKRFQSLENIRSASLEELEQTEGMNKRSAEAVYAFFQEANNPQNRVLVNETD